MMDLRKNENEQCSLVTLSCPFIQTVMILRIIHQSSCFSSIKMKMTVIIFAISSCSTPKIHDNIATNGKITHLVECYLRDCIHNFFHFTQINPVMIPDG